MHTSKILTPEPIVSMIRVVHGFYGQVGGRNIPAAYRVVRSLTDSSAGLDKKRQALDGHGKSVNPPRERNNPVSQSLPEKVIDS